MVITKDMKDFFLNIIRELFEKEEFLKEFKASRAHSSISYDYEELDIGQNFDIEAHSGATRLCLLIDSDYGYDYVVKIPYIDRAIDYCAREVEIYEKAKQLGIQEIFAECALLEVIVIEGIEFPIYLMEKVDGSYWDLDGMCFSYYKEKIYDGDVSDDESIIADQYAKELYEEELFEEYELALAASYGEKHDVLKTIRQFIYEESINDLHSGNMGVVNGKVVLIDYAGYRG